MVTVRTASSADLPACLDVIRMLPDFFTPDVVETVRREFGEHACWQHAGFVQVDTIDPLPGWQPGNPAAIYVAALRSTRPVG